MSEMGRDPELGVLASVVMDPETHGPRALGLDCGRGLRDLEQAIDYGNLVVPPGALVDEINIGSTYSLHAALYGLQQAAAVSPDARRALELIGCSGDVEEHVAPDTLLPLPVSRPPDWRDT